jgi:hypothetical protein
MGQGLLGFPHPVNEKAARTVAAVVFVTSVVALATSSYWLLIPLAYGFWARVLTGPNLSPLGAFAMKVAGPRLGQPRYVSGPPKRFAQGMGAAMTTIALVAWLAGADAVADVLLALMIVASGLEAVFAFCLGCKVFGLLMRLGAVPDDVCAECADIWSRPRAAQ